MSEIILARHAETIWNEQQKYIGRTDLGLSSLGANNADRLSDYLAGQPVKMVFSSNQKRATQTAQRVAERLNLGLIEEPDLREIDFGVWEGLTFSQIQSAYPELARVWGSDPTNVQVPEAEAWAAFFARVWNGWGRTITKITETDIAQESSEKSVYVIVTHAGCIKLILGRLMGLEDRDCWQIFQDKGALNYLELIDGNIKITGTNDTDYRKNP